MPLSFATILPKMQIHLSCMGEAVCWSLQRQSLLSTWGTIYRLCFRCVMFACHLRARATSHPPQSPFFSQSLGSWSVVVVGCSGYLGQHQNFAGKCKWREVSSGACCCNDPASALLPRAMGERGDPACLQPALIPPEPASQGCVEVEWIQSPVLGVGRWVGAEPVGCVPSSSVLHCSPLAQKPWCV